MRTTAFVLFFALVIIACGQSPKLQAPAEPQRGIALDAGLHDKLELGLPTHVELRAGDERVGTCTVIYDLWDERFEVSRSQLDLGSAREVEAALRRCIEQPTAQPIRVHEIAHATKPTAQYPIF